MKNQTIRENNTKALENNAEYIKRKKEENAVILKIETESRNFIEVAQAEILMYTSKLNRQLEEQDPHRDSHYILLRRIYTMRDDERESIRINKNVAFNTLSTAHDKRMDTLMNKYNNIHDTLKDLVRNGSLNKEAYEGVMYDTELKRVEEMAEYVAEHQAEMTECIAKYEAEKAECEARYMKMLHKPLGLL